MATEPITFIEAESDPEISLLEILDHVFSSGVVIHGSIVVSLAGVDLLYIGLNAVLTSVETALQHLGRATMVEKGKKPARLR